MARPRRDGPVDDRKSRSQKKREMHFLQDLGARLIQLPRAELAGLGLPDDLVEAVAELSRIKSREAKRRQEQYIGKLMRDVDPEPIAERLGELDRARTAASDSEKRLTALRDGLVAGDEEAFRRLVRDFSEADPAGVRELALQARAEIERGKPPKASRQLLRYLRRLDYIEADEGHVLTDWDENE